jgi:hypothetical protein
MGRLHDWWRRLTGDPPQPAPSPRRTPSPPAAPGPAAGLKLAEDVPQHRPSRVGEAGFDPYGSDAGYAKLHTWERVDHD